LNILNVKSCAIRQSKELTSFQNSEVGIWKVPFGDLLDRLQKELEGLQRRLPVDTVREPFLVKESNNGGFCSRITSSLPSETCSRIGGAQYDYEQQGSHRS